MRRYARATKRRIPGQMNKTGANMRIDPEKVFRAYLRQEGVNGQPESEFVFARPRKWRFDYAWISGMVALEVEGGIWTGGRHTRGAGFLKDMEKYNAAAVRGWVVLRTTPANLCTRETIRLITAALAMRVSA